MDEAESSTIIEGFNACIADRDVERLSTFLTDDHVFIDSKGQRVVGKTACLEAWRGFFSAFPDYRNTFERTQVADSDVAIVGRSVCSDPRLDGPALWSAKLRGLKILEWRVYDDTPANRERLGLSN